MKKVTFTLFTVLSTILFTYGQQTPVIEKRAQNVFVEFLGQGLLVTANYDRRFNNTRGGLGSRIGIGYISEDKSSITTIPIGINYLLGKRNNFFEMGLGLTYIRGKLTSSLFNSSDNNTSTSTGDGIIGTMSFSYRLQPVDSGFGLRAGITPIFRSEFFMPFFFGVSLGYTF